MNRSFIARAMQGVVLVGLSIGGALAAGGSDNANAQERYRQEAAACNAGQSAQDRATCMQEAGAALDEARRGRLDQSSVAASTRTGNAVARCEVFTGEELSACRARALGTAPAEGATITRGSVEGGGVIRETIQVYEVPAGTPGSVPAQ
ncbi:MAG: hypothetical protein KA795_06210 [Burkholderiaceae bacterium]|nr:hypothetical protein [Burkholderiaceae bacterium]